MSGAPSRVSSVTDFALLRGLRAERSIELVCWDWNGTLLDDVELCRSIMNVVLEARGLPPIMTTAHYRSLFRFPIIDFYESVGITADEFPVAADHYLALLETKAATSHLHAGARAVLDEVRALGIRQILASATRHASLARQLEPHDIADRFETVLGITDAYAPSKQRVIRDWIERAGVVRDRVLIIGDTTHDQEIAAHLGARFLHCTLGHQELALGPAVRQVDNLHDVLANL